MPNLQANGAFTGGESKDEEDGLHNLLDTVERHSSTRVVPAVSPRGTQLGSGQWFYLHWLLLPSVRAGFHCTLTAS